MDASSQMYGVPLCHFSLGHHKAVRWPRVAEFQGFLVEINTQPCILFDAYRSFRLWLHALARNNIFFYFSCLIFTLQEYIISCNECHHNFKHVLRYTRGDPRNIALIGHWDGFRPFRSTGKHGCGENYYNHAINL